MELRALKENTQIKSFDCGDADLNDFIFSDAKQFYEKRIGKTFLLMDGERVAAYFCLLNDKITKVEASNSAWRRVKKLFPHDKHFSSYPAVKIGRLAVSLDYRGTGLGSKLISIIRHSLFTEETFSTFRFLTVDAYLSAVPFYQKNGFSLLVPDDGDKHTRLMYYDMKAK